MAEIVYELPTGQLAMISIDATVEEVPQVSALITEHAVEEGGNVSDHVRPENDRLTLSFVISNTPINVPQTNADGVTGSIQPLQFAVAGAPRRLDGNPILTTPFFPGRFIGSTPRISINVGPFFRATFGAGLKTLPTPERPQFQPQPLLPGGELDAGASTLQFSQPFDRISSVYEELRDIIRSGIVVSIITSLRTYNNMALANLSAPRTADTANAVEFSVDATQVRIVSTETVAAPEPVQVRGNVQTRKGPRPPGPTTEAEQVKAKSMLKKFQDSGQVA
jgi:hypothetical protein